MLGTMASSILGRSRFGWYDRVTIGPGIFVQSCAFTEARMISFDCPSCGKNLTVKDDLAGKKGKCPKCRGVIMVPGQAVPVAGQRGSSSRPDEPKAIGVPRRSA